MNVVESIIDKLNKRFNGRLDCNEQRADLFVYIDGNQQTIIAVDTEMIYFDNPAYNISLYNADIQHLVYIDYVLG